MKNFIVQIIVFFAFFGLIFLLGIFLPVTPKSKNNMLSFKVEKDLLLKNVKEPRMIFIGGSNLVFGLNSEMIKDSLGINPINDGMAASIGLIYMMDDILPYIRPGDYIVMAPEYHHFYGNLAYGGNDLFRLLMDVEKSGFTRLRLNHWPNLIKSVPTYFISKFKLNNYSYDGENDVYGKHIFNEYGDSDFHWGLEKRDFETLHPIRGSFNYDMIKEINSYNEILADLGATLLVTYPCCQASSIEVVKDKVEKIEEELEKTNLHILGTAERYAMPDSLMFDTPWHLTKEGVDLRTKLLIEDIKDSDLLKEELF